MATKAKYTEAEREAARRLCAVAKASLTAASAGGIDDSALYPVTLDYLRGQVVLEAFGEKDDWLVNWVSA